MQKKILWRGLQPHAPKPHVALLPFHSSSLAEKQNDSSTDLNIVSLIYEIVANMLL